MSTTIYNGYRLPKMDLVELKEWIAPLRPIVKRETNRHVYQTQFNRALWYLDLASVMTANEFEKETTRGEKRVSLSSSPYFAARRELQKEVRSMYRGDMDIDVSVSFIGIEDATLVCWYGGEIPSIKEAFEALPHLEEYCYYNNVDEPEDVTESEWEKRKVDWTAALSPSWVVSEEGFSIELNSGIPVVVEQIPIEIPDRLKRAKELAFILLEKEMLQTAFEAKQKITAYELLEHFRSEKGKAEIQAKAEKLVPLLHETVDDSVLLQPFSTLFLKNTREK